jgi:hypothetical protein
LFHVHTFGGVYSDGSVTFDLQRFTADSQALVSPS